MRVRLNNERLAAELAKSPQTLNRWAQRMGLSSGHLSLLVNGHRPYPTARTRQRILDTLDLEFEDLFEIELDDGGQAVPPGGATTGTDSPSAHPSPSAPHACLRRFSERGATQPRRRGWRSRLGGGSRGARRGGSAGTSGEELPPMPRPFDSLLDWWTDLRWAARRLARRPGFALTAATTLAVGIGANVALFGVVNSILLKPYPYPEPERLFVIGCHPEDRASMGSCSWPDVRDLREMLSGVVDLSPWDWEPASLAGGARPERIGTAMVTANYGRILGTPLLRGRFFDEEEHRRGARVAVVTEKLWKESFGADPAIVGRTVLLDGIETEIVGVAPHAMRSIDGVQMYVPMRASDDPEARGSHWLGVTARIAPDVEPMEAQAALTRAMGQLAETHPRTNEGKTATLVALREARTAEVRPILVTLLGVVFVVLLIACANVANLLLSQASSRREEIGLRSALGADRGRLVRQLLCACLVLGVLGLAGGLALGLWGSRAALRLIPAEEVPSWIDPGADLRVFVYAAAVALATALVAGIYPALRQTAALDAAVRSGGASMRTGRASRGFVVAEVALSVVLLCAAGWMVRSLLHLASSDPGFDSESAVVVGLDLLALRGEEPLVRRTRFLEYYDAFSALPGVEAVGVIDRMPLGSGRNRSGITPETPVASEFDPMVLVSNVSPGYFAAMGIPMLSGADFDLVQARLEALRPPAGGGEDDPSGGDGADAAEEVLPLIVSRSLAESVWPEGEALGQRVKFARPDDEAPWWTVVGVVADVAHDSLAPTSRRAVYMSQGAIGMVRASWVVRADLSAPVLLEELQRTVREIDPTQPLWGVRTLEEHVQRSVWQERFVSTLFVAFAVVASLLAAFGLYSVISYAMAQRRYEMGVRMALGATGRNVARLVIGQGLRLVAVGALLGLALAAAAGRMLAGVLQGVRPGDPVVVAWVLALLLAVAASAVALPARRAARVDPVESLRSE
ncbi:MAG: hypothetical protein DWQ30_17555 [Acidobacteria bacterium]|nr:MAG: hypothetical protein DWQ30_17555 [Acidobacteriota bacterium]